MEELDSLKSGLNSQIQQVHKQFESQEEAQQKQIEDLEQKLAAKDKKLSEMHKLVEEKNNEA